MDTGTLPARPDGDSAPRTSPVKHPAGLGAEVRESLLLLTFAVGVTVGLTAAAQAALALLA